MQEAIDRAAIDAGKKVGRLVIDFVAKPTAGLLASAMQSICEHRRTPSGEMSVKELAAQDKGMQSIDITDDNIGSFRRCARKYGVDFALYKAKGAEHYKVFFKAQDMSAIESAFEDYSRRVLQPQCPKRPSILEKLSQYREKVKSDNRGYFERPRDKERDISR